MRGLKRNAKRKRKRRKNKLNYLKLYHSLSKIAIYSICLVICAGAFVRMTGSGMGCPDWPKCFGSWIPPMSITDLPDNYKEIYSEKHTVEGYDELDFNVFNTWTEYINRLLGALAGLFCFGLLIISVLMRNRSLILLSLLLVSLMIFQAWMGAIVVYSILSPFKITLHLLIALIIVLLLLFLYYITSDIQNTSVKIKYQNIKYKWVLLAISISILQVVLGTQVRESVDILLHSYDKINVISELPVVFDFHKTMAWLVLFSNGILVFHCKKVIKKSVELKAIIIVICLLLISGLLMTHYSLIGVAQWLHLISAISLCMFQFSILLKRMDLPTVKSP